MRVFPWIMTCALSLALLLALGQARSQFAELRTHRNALAQTQQRLHELRREAARRATLQKERAAFEELLRQAEQAGLRPESWLVSRLDLGPEPKPGAGKDAIAKDPRVKELEQEKSDALLRAQAAAPGKPSPAEARALQQELERIAARHDLLVKQRRDALALERRFNAARLAELLAALSSSSQPGRGRWFIPETFRVTRAASDAFDVAARGIFLTRAVEQ
jgi:DNA repair exonuclease SbcCD ATPase subunit